MMKIRLKEINHAHSFSISSAIEGTTLNNEHFLAEVNYTNKTFSIYLDGKEVFKKDSVPRSFEYCDDTRGSIHQLLSLSKHYGLDLEQNHDIPAPQFDLIQLNEKDLQVGLAVFHPLSQNGDVPDWSNGHDLGVIKSWALDDFFEMNVYFVCQNSIKPLRYNISNLWIIVS
jgi:hypothetical protein